LALSLGQLAEYIFDVSASFSDALLIEIFCAKPDMDEVVFLFLGRSWEYAAHHASWLLSWLASRRARAGIWADPSEQHTWWWQVVDIYSCRWWFRELFAASNVHEPGGEIVLRVLDVRQHALLVGARAEPARSNQPRLNEQAQRNKTFSHTSLPSRSHQHEQDIDPPRLCGMLL
jgi:hypothetical protein